MITVPEAVEIITRKSPFLEEALSLGIMNISALARVIMDEVRRETMKDVKEGAVVMALNRLSAKVKQSRDLHRKVFSSPPDLMVRSNLFEVTLLNSDRLAQKRKKLLDQIGPGKNYFITFTQGIYETTIIASRELKEKVVKVFEDERIISTIENLSSITVQLPQGTADFPGAYSYILRPLAWEQINVIEVVSTLNEFTIVLRDGDIDKAFFVIKRIF